jgi:hypothetical protein
MRESSLAMTIHDFENYFYIRNKAEKAAQRHAPINSF